MTGTGSDAATARRPRRRLTAAAAAVSLLATLACAAGGPAPAGRQPAGGASPPASVALRAATTEYYQAGPSDPVVELRVIVENGGLAPTASTSISWDPAWSAEFVFLDSDPPPWRVRVDSNGWGVLDTSGVIGGQYGTFRVWFAAGTYALREPQITVVVGGGQVLAETVAAASHLKWAAPAPAQQTFERGRLASFAEAVGVLPVDPASTFRIAVVLGLVLSAMLLAGSVAAFVRLGSVSFSGKGKS